MPVSLLAGVLALTATACAAEGEGITLPSGLAAHLHEVIEEAGDDGPLARLRYVAAAFDPAAMTPEATLEDMRHICREVALPRLAPAPEGQTVVVSLADRAAPFGVMNADVAQIFEVFAIRDDACIWEPF